MESIEIAAAERSLDQSGPDLLDCFGHKPAVCVKVWLSAEDGSVWAAIIDFLDLFGTTLPGVFLFKPLAGEY